MKWNPLPQLTELTGYNFTLFQTDPYVYNSRPLQNLTKDIVPSFRRTGCVAIPYLTQSVISTKERNLVFKDSKCNQISRLTPRNDIMTHSGKPESSDFKDFF